MADKSTLTVVYTPNSALQNFLDALIRIARVVVESILRLPRRHAWTFVDSSVIVVDIIPKKCLGGPGHTKDFFGVLAKTRGIFPGFHDIRGRRQIFRAAFSFHPASEWMNSAAEEFPPRFMACDVIFEKFQKEPL